MNNTLSLKAAKTYADTVCTEINGGRHVGIINFIIHIREFYRSGYSHGYEAGMMAAREAILQSLNIAKEFKQADHNCFNKFIEVNNNNPFKIHNN